MTSSSTSSLQGSQSVQTPSHPMAPVFGRGPYKFLGYSKSEYQAAPGEPVRAGSSCDYCGHSIMHVYWFENSVGERFKVGADCAETALCLTAADLLRLRESRRDFVLGLRRAASEARTAAQREARRLETERLEAEMRAEIAAETQRRQAMTFVGKVGERQSFRVTRERTLVFGHESPWGPTYLVVFRDTEGNAIVYKGGKPPSRAVTGDDGSGIWVEFSAGVKAHTVYEPQGVGKCLTAIPQTLVERITKLKALE